MCSLACDQLLITVFILGCKIVSVVSSDQVFILLEGSYRCRCRCKFRCAGCEILSECRILADNIIVIAEEEDLRCPRVTECADHGCLACRFKRVAVGDELIPCLRNFKTELLVIRLVIENRAALGCEGRNTVNTFVIGDNAQECLINFVNQLLLIRDIKEVL